VRGILAWLTAAGLVLAPAGARAERLYGLVIGIDEYRHIADLKGAVNDARDIGDALRSIGAEVVTLLNGEATRAAILAEWTRLADGLGPGDRLIVTYAGHGTNEPERIAGNEADGRDETLLLSGFAPYGAAAGERIVDDEIAALIARAGEGRTIFVADACHSGTLSRDIAPVLGYRYVSVGRIEADPLPPPPPPVAADEGREKTALFLGASDDSEKTPEFLIDGRPRGALSYAFALALRGAADADGDGILTKGEVETFVRRTVRSTSRGAQRPQVAPAGEADRPIFVLPGGAAPVPVPPPPTIAGVRFEALPPVTLSHNGGARTDRLLGDLPGLSLVPQGTPADLRLDVGTGRLLSMVGDTVARLDAASPSEIHATVAAAIGTQRLATALADLRADMDVRFAGGDRTYREGDIVTVEITGRRDTGLALVNIASDGRMTLLYPRPLLGDPETLPADDTLGLPLRVEAPFGADHVIAIETGPHPGPLAALLAQLDGTREPAALWEGLGALADEAGEAPRVAVFPFHSVPGPAQ
jgi:hypothetical protein